MSIPFPLIDPVAISLGPVDIRWYALAYLLGFIGAWRLSMRLAPHFNLRAEDLDDFITWGVIGIILGGRLGYILFYNLDFYLENPQFILQLWNGGMAFHGGLLGLILAMILFTRWRELPLLSIADIAAICAPIGLFFGRIANFINAELVGRVTDVPWAFIFPNSDGQPRHPSQLYEALAEGLLLFILTASLARSRTLRNTPGMLAGVFLCFYGTSRFLIEFTREPDAQIGFLYAGATMGQILCLPMVVLGLFLITRKPIHAG